ncbi:MAG: hypothetical protein JOZ73_09400 [Solirubrobacterales bacterium]|nr:hypothetical protein [Solirubrobacterales bacterium]
MKVLVLTSEPVSASQLREALPGGVEPEQTEVMVVAPALQPNSLKFWLSDADSAITRADEVRRETIENLGESGVPATGDTGESDPVRALEDALTTFPAERILLFTHADDAQGYREDLDVAELKSRFGIPVEQATVGGSAA